MLREVRKHCIMSIYILLLLSRKQTARVSLLLEYLRPQVKALLWLFYSESLFLIFNPEVQCWLFL